MIEINLLPSARRAKTSTREPIQWGALTGKMSGAVKDKFLVVAIAGFLIGAGGGGFLYFSQERREADLNERRDKAVRDSTRFANALADRYKSEAIRDTLLRQVNIIRSLDDDRYIWPHILDEVSRALPQYTWLTVVAAAGAPQGQNNVVVSPKVPEDTSAAAKKRKRPPKRLETEIPRDVVQFRLTGRTVDIQALTRFMKDLEASPFLANVQLERSELAMELNKEVTQFQLLITYSRPDTLLLHRVPLVLSTTGGK